MNTRPDAQKKTDLKTLGGRIRFSRDVANLSRRELAEMTGMSSRTIEHYENGTTDATYQKLCVLAENLRVEIAWLVSGDDPGEIETDFQVMLDARASEENDQTCEMPSRIQRLETSFAILAELRNAGLEKHVRKATAIMQEVHGSAKYIEPEELTSFATRRGIFILKDYSPEAFSDLINASMDRAAVEVLCTEIVDRLIDRALLGINLFQVNLKDLATMAAEWEILPNRILAFGWRGHEEIVPALRSRLRQHALLGKKAMDSCAP